jgi:hypothetical protein
MSRLKNPDLAARIVRWHISSDDVLSQKLKVSRQSAMLPLSHKYTMSDSRLFGVPNSCCSNVIEDRSPESAAASADELTGARTSELPLYKYFKARLRVANETV